MGTETATGKGPPANDIQAALTVMGRCISGFNERNLNLAKAHIPKADLSNAHLSSAHLSSAHLGRCRPRQRPPASRRPERRRPHQRPLDLRQPERRRPERRRPQQRPPDWALLERSSVALNEDLVERMRAVLAGSEPMRDVKMFGCG